MKSALSNSCLVGKSFSEKLMKKIHSIVFSVMTALLCFVLVSCGERPEKYVTDTGESRSEIKTHYSLENGCEIIDIKGVSGVFPEDGRDVETDNTAAIVVRNKSDRHFQLMNIVIETDKGTLEFQLTTLFSGSKMTVFEKNAKQFDNSMTVESVQLTRSVEFTEEPTVHPDVFEITVHDAVLNIKNISENDINGDIYVYYKSTDENSDWYGGITYRTCAGGGLKSGELRQLPANHFKNGSSKVVFVTYAE